MSCEELVAGCFAGDQAPFALGDVAREWGMKYLEGCARFGLLAAFGLARRTTTQSQFGG